MTPANPLQRARRARPLVRARSALALTLTLSAAALLLLPDGGRAGSAGRPALPQYPRYAQAMSPLDQWQRRTAPVLVADQEWEQGAVYEPTVLYSPAQRLYQMWYTGGWAHAAIGYAASADGVHWRKRRGPVVGLGAGGWSACAARGDVLRAAGAYWLFFAGDETDHALHVATSADGRAWTTHAGAVLAPIAGQTRLANTAVWVEGNTWHMLYESLTEAGIWEMGLAQSVGAAPTHWRRVAFPLRSLQVGAGAYGGPAISGSAGHYDLYYHAARAGNLPTDVYHATSADLLHWHQATRGQGPVLPRALPWEVDQTADPFVAQGAPTRGDGRLLYYAGMDNGRPAGAIGLAREHGPGPAR